MTERRGAGFAAVVAALVCLHLALALPNHPAALRLSSLAVWQPELPVLVLALAAAPHRLTLPLRAALTLALAAMTAVKLADIGGHAAFLRPFDPVLDRHLIVSAWQLLAGAAGRGLALAAVAAVLVALWLWAALLWWATGRIAAAGARHRRAAALALVPAVAMALVLPAATTRLAFDHVQSARQAGLDLAAFRDEAARDPGANASLAALAGTDVAVIFVESYGRTALANPRYAATIGGVLAEAEAALSARGLAMRSAWLASPIRGGQSWLAHATLLSGLRIDSQARYRALIASPRRTLPALAAAAGWQVEALVPAITLPWPEATYFGFGHVLNAKALAYRGAAFGWAAIPDQFTLATFARRLAIADRPPVFAQVTLISSHAPWTPIPPRLDWEAIGDGRAFTAAMTAGPTPAELWRDREQVRAHYRDALAYSLRITGEFLARNDPPLLAIMLGDHQPADFVAEGAGGGDVPVHLIGPPELLARIEGWGWTPGLRPGPGAPVWPMSAFRDRFLAAFSEPSPTSSSLPRAATH